MKTLFAGLVLLLVVPFAQASDDDAARVIAEQLPVYPMSTCLVSGEALGGEDMGAPIDMVHEGRLVRLCCKGCVKTFNKDPLAILMKLDAAVIASQAPSYPFDSCLVSDESLGDMSDTTDVIADGRLYRLCCNGCKRKLDKDPKAFRAALDAAYIEKQLSTYPSKNCVVSGEPLGGMGDTIDILYGTRLVRFCCKGCKKEFAASPARFLAKLAPAPKGERKKEAHHGEHHGEHEGHRGGDHDGEHGGEHDGDRGGEHGG